ncbi:MAG: serine protease [Gammaproteobacteria bacterium]|nr:serine protease [Gammaproteobacteria bacterium]MCP4089826.1 serine protease [Gammaproteobacteria bacterium]MCP4275350.1 serine protease [Gammaproteobacteria bacterium]MCP4831241.1 serine protease [Gammaproteobacteria bacterium]MCP4927652.1 serine protease [Gammaproteobacteria bacterium]
MKKILLLQTFFLISLAGCISNGTENTNKQGSVGSDRDEFGCIGSAGYSWCKHTNKCERPWELAEQEGFENTHENFQAHCETLQP